MERELLLVFGACRNLVTQYSPTPRKPIYRRWWFIVVTILVVLWAIGRATEKPAMPLAANRGHHGTTTLINTTSTIAQTTTTTEPPPTTTRPPTTVPLTTVPPTTVVTATTIAVTLCGAPPNPYHFNQCGDGALIYSPPSDICNYFNCIESFWDGTGYMTECNDGTYSMSGGHDGACSYHDGEGSPVYDPG